FVKQYNVGFLNASRTGSSSISTAVTMGSSGGGESGGGSTSGGSTSSIEIAYEGSIWDDLEENIEQILTSSDTFVSLATMADPIARPYNPAPPPPALNP